MALESLPRENYPSDYLPRAMYRRPMYGDGTTLAMHWDGTYRDHDAYSNGFWTDLDYANYGHPTTARFFARHLESREETDHRLGYLSDDELELLSDLQRRQI